MPKRLLSVLQAMINPEETGDGGNTMRTAVPINVRAHAVVGLGKVSLHNEQMAKKCVAAFSRELQVSPSPIAAAEPSRPPPV